MIISLDWLSMHFVHYSTLLYSTLLYYTTILYYTILYYTILYYTTILYYYTILYHTILYNTGYHCYCSQSVSCCPSVDDVCHIPLSFFPLCSTCLLPIHPLLLHTTTLSLHASCPPLLYQDHNFEHGTKKYRASTRRAFDIMHLLKIYIQQLPFLDEVQP